MSAGGRAWSVKSLECIMYYDILIAEQAQQNVMDITLITKLAYPYVRATFVP